MLIPTLHPPARPGERLAVAQQSGVVTPPADDGLSIKLSPRSVPETVNRLSELLAAKQIKLFTIIDHSGEAAANGLELRDTKLVIFGSPKAGTPVMQAQPLAALDLPLRVLIWDDEGQTKVAYTPPPTLAARYGLRDELATRLAAIDQLTDALTKS
jgi:uncharacterized protein (DUF302 family)